MYQKHVLSYPVNFLRADATITEIADYIHKCGIVIPEEVVEFYHDPRCKKVIIGHDTAEAVQEELGKKYIELGCKDFTEKVQAAQNEFRNLVAMNAIEDYMSIQAEGKAYLQYGNNHVRGIRELAEARGWMLVGEPRVLEFEEE